MTRFISFSSGSCGNCSYLGDDKGAVLIDAGVSFRKLKAEFERFHLSFDDVKAILVTHDHLDHIRNLEMYCRKLQKPVYASAQLAEALARHTFTRISVPSYTRVLPQNEATAVAGMIVRWFEVPHDATHTVGFHISNAEHKFVIMTDIGRMTDEAVSFARTADTVVIESNYDLQMLLAGPYTYELKMRIIQGCGHMSNDECADAIKRIWHQGLRNLFLCHLSENNNTPELALENARNALSEIGVAAGVLPAGSDPSTPLVTLRHLPRHTSSGLITL